MIKVDNKRQGTVTIEGHVLQPGIGQLPNELAGHWYVKALAAENELTILSEGTEVPENGPLENGHDPYGGSGYTGPVAGDPVLDDDGNPVLDENGEPMVYQPEEE